MWKAHHGITYLSQNENAYREKVFFKNLKEIQEHNAQDRSYTKGVNQFTAMTHEEWAQAYLTFVPDSDVKISHSSDKVENLKDFDWRTEGAVTEVRDQGACGSCWAFSAIGSLEGLSKLHDGELMSFSEQQLVDCAYITWGNLACNGGQMYNAFAYIRDKGIVERYLYPYTAKKGTCKIPAGNLYKISNHTRLTESCTDLANSLAGRPVSVAVDATNWKDYKEGTFKDCSTSLNHGVLLVGSTDEAWIIKNSWGLGWGNHGYINLATGNTCGICNSAATYPNK